MVKKAISGDARYMGDLGDLDFNNLDGFLGNHLQYDEDNKRWNILAV
jgi:hypothetical protein